MAKFLLIVALFGMATFAHAATAPKEASTDTQLTSTDDLDVTSCDCTGVSWTKYVSRKPQVHGMNQVCKTRYGPQVLRLGGLVASGSLTSSVILKQNPAPNALQAKDKKWAGRRAFSFGCPCGQKLSAYQFCTSTGYTRIETTHLEVVCACEPKSKYGWLCHVTTDHESFPGYNVEDLSNDFSFRCVTDGFPKSK